jgi:hypothetical protein
MKFEKIRFIDIGIKTAGDGRSPASPLKDLPSNYDSFIDNCLYILRKYP